MRNELETVVYFCEAQQTVAVAGIDFFDHRTALGVAKIKTQRNAVGEFIVRAHIVQIGERRRATRWPSGKSECPGRICAAAGVPEVLAIGQPQTVNIGAQHQIFAGTEHQLREEIPIIHFIEERESRVNAWCRQYCKKGPVRVVRRVAISAGVEITATNPRPNRRQNMRLETNLSSPSRGTLRQRAPLPAL